MINDLRKTPAFSRVVDVVLIIKDFNLVMTGNLVRLVHIYVRSLLICRKDDLVIDVELAGVVEDHFKMIGPLHMISASPMLRANMRNLLISLLQEILLSLIQVIVVVIFDVWVLVVLMLPSNSEDYIMLSGKILVIGIDQLELVIIRDVIVLLDEGSATIQYYSIFLDKKLWILMFQEWSKIGMSPEILECLLIIFISLLEFIGALNVHRLFLLKLVDLIHWWFLELFDIFDLDFVVSFKRSVLRIGMIVVIVLDLMSRKWINSNESHIAGSVIALIIVFDVAHVLNGFSEWWLSCWSRELLQFAILNFENYQFFVSVF